MDAEIHSVDTDKRESEGNLLHVRGARIEFSVKRFEGLAFGSYKDQHFLVLQATSWEDSTQSTFKASLTSEELQQLFAFALKSQLIDGPVKPRILELLELLREELTAQE